jgi:glycerol-3-phosphate dehydrogenase
MNIGIIGGGINGLCCAWVLANAGHNVCLYERHTLLHATSRSSSKLLHGGLRYLENGEFRLVREALRERDGWLRRNPQFAWPIRLIMPIYRNSRRNRLLVGAGLFLYDRLAGQNLLPKTSWLSTKQILSRDPNLKDQDLIGGYEFYDAQMDDLALGRWVADQLKDIGVNILENTEISKVTTEGDVVFKDLSMMKYDFVLNVAGPWAYDLLEKSHIDSPYTLDLVRGSHLILNQGCKQAFLLEVPGQRRIIFVLPWKQKTLLGTTEIRQSITDPIICSNAEKDYLLDSYRYYWPDADPQIVETFSGVRPLIRSATDPNRATREYAVYRAGRLLTVFGGKWTTAMALANKVNALISNT